MTVRGYRRLFNLRPEHYDTSHKLSDAQIENAAMNVEPVPDATFNGLGFPATQAELEALDARERYYERQVAEVYRFESDEVVGEGHFYVAPPDAPWLERDPRKLLPLWRDIVWARTGAYGVSQRFGQYYDDTTYLADGTTLMVDRYREVLHLTEDVEPPS